MGEGGQIDLQVMSACLVHEIDADQDLGDQLHGLEGQVEISFQAGGVADHNGGIDVS